MDFSLHSKVILYPLTIRKDKKHYIVEDKVTGDFFEMPELAVKAIEAINQGISPAQIEIDLRESYPEEAVDMRDFIKQLLSIGLVREIDGQEIKTTKVNHSPDGFQWIPPRLGKIFFGFVSKKLYLAVIIMNLIFLFLNPGLLPHYQDLFVFDIMVGNVLFYMAVSFVLILIHESGHIMAIRAHGLPAKLEVGNRLFLVVFETDLTPAWKLEPKQRNTLYLAGIYFDQCLIFLALAITLLFPEANELFLGILGIIILDLFIKFIYQCCFYMKTDLYYLFENITGCYNVMENGKLFLSKWLPFIKKEAITQAFENETRTIRLYSCFYLIGIALTFFLFLFYFIPQVVYAFSNTVPALFQPGFNSDFWDAVVFIGQITLGAGFLLYSAWKKHRINKVAIK